jgi:hypothetical protein
MEFNLGTGERRRHIGFGATPARMEEWEQRSAEPLPMGRADVASGVAPEATYSLLLRLMDEREHFTRLLTEKKIRKAEALRLLGDNRELILFMQGGSPYKFATEKVIRWLLLFSTAITLILAGFHAAGKLDAAVMTTFVGTTVGGTLTTIAQKLGKVGR